METIPEIIDGLPNISGSEDLVERAVKEGAKKELYLNQTPLDFNRIKSTVAIALHMHQPLITAGGSALQSGNVGNSDRSAIQTTVLGPSTVSFWWKASTQATDLVRFYVDAVNRANASGALPWTQVSLAIGNGTHVLKWEYAKDAAMAGNQDMALIDQVVAATGNAVPTTPLGLAVTVATSIQLNWSAPSSNGGAAITAYEVYRSTTAGSETLLATLGNVLTYTSTGLTNGQAYYYKVSAVNSVGESSKSSEASATPVAPATVPTAPQSPAATAGSAQVVLRWSAPASNGGAAITAYKVYRSTTSGTETLLATLGNVLTYTSTGLTNCQTYYYKVSAVNSIGEGAQSSEASATPVSSSTVPTVYSDSSDARGLATRSSRALKPGSFSMTRTISSTQQSCRATIWVSRETLSGVAAMP